MHLDVHSLVAILAEPSRYLNLRTRVLYAPAESRAVLETEYTDACGIRPAWADLVDQAGLVDFDLSETKTAFSITTRQQVTALPLCMAVRSGTFEMLAFQLLLLPVWQANQALQQRLPS